MQPLDIVFAGTPEFAASHLDSLLGGNHRVIAVYTQPDRKAGRGKKLLASPVKVLAEKHGIPVKQPASLKEPSAQEEFRALKADLLLVVAYGLILPQAILEIPRLGCINVHASLLPRWRGAAPIERSLLAGDQETGVTIMQMDAGLDTGDMLRRSAVPIEASDNRETLEQKLAAAGIELVEDRDQAWRDFAGWRVNYDAVLLGLAEYVHAPYAPWTSDRSTPDHRQPRRRRLWPGLRG